MIDCQPGMNYLNSDILTMFGIKHIQAIVSYYLQRSPMDFFFFFFRSLLPKCCSVQWTSTLKNWSALNHFAYHIGSKKYVSRNEK